MAGRTRVGSLVSSLVFSYLLGCAQAALAADSAETQIPKEGPPSVEQTNAEVSAAVQNPNDVSYPVSQRQGRFEFGLGLGIVDMPQDVGLGLDVMLGYQWIKSDNWNMGGLFHYQNSSLTNNGSFQTVGLFATASPELKWLSWLQFRAGLASDDYSTTVTTISYTPNYTQQKTVISWSGTGAAIGAGLVMGDSNWRIHVLDVERHFVAGHSFNIYTISVAVLSR